MPIGVDAEWRCGGKFWELTVKVGSSIAVEVEVDEVASLTALETEELASLRTD